MTSNTSQSAVADGDNVEERPGINPTSDDSEDEAKVELDASFHSLAEKIREAHQDLESHTQQGAQKAIELGKRLIEAKKKLKKRSFKRWFDGQKFAFTHRSATDYMVLTRKWTNLSPRKREKIDLTTVSARGLKAAINASARPSGDGVGVKQRESAPSADGRARGKVKQPVAANRPRAESADHGISDALDSCSDAFRPATDAARRFVQLVKDDSKLLTHAPDVTVETTRSDAVDLQVAIEQMLAIFDATPADIDMAAPPPKKPATGGEPKAITETAAAKAVPSSNTTGRPGVSRG